MNNVYIVHCIDTEGPMYEGIQSIFDRVQELFGISMDPTPENLIKLQNGDHEFHNIKAPLMSMLTPGRIATLGTWGEIDQMLDDVQSIKFRNSLLDSDNKGWVYNWFCMDHVGFTGANPRKRDFGDHKIFDHYMSRSQTALDQIQWHYHPIPYCGNYHGSGTAYLNSNNIWSILSKKIIERNWFPNSFRPGFHTERPDSHWFLEQWIPFDYANQSASHLDSTQPDLENGHYGDWRSSPQKWFPYHPAHDDHRIPGGCNRWITRCLSLDSRKRSLNLSDVQEAFELASNDGNALLSFTNHDFRSIYQDVAKVKSYILEASKKYPNVRFHYSTSTNGFRNCLGLKKCYPELEAEIRFSGNHADLMVTASDSIFGSQPYLALKMKNGDYIWENFDFISTGNWSFTFHSNHIPLNLVEKIGVAANSISGISEVINFDESLKNVKKYIYDN